MAKMVRPSELIPNPVLSDGETIPHLTESEYETLRASIEAHGILQPIVVAWPERVIIDGHHRWRVALDLGFAEVPVTLDETHTADQQEELGIQLNAARRHWTREAREKAIRKRLKRAPHRSDRDIAGTLSVDHKTVAKYRLGMEATGEIPHFEFRTDKQGAKRKASGTPRPTREATPRTPTPSENIITKIEPETFGPGVTNVRRADPTPPVGGAVPAPSKVRQSEAEELPDAGVRLPGGASEGLASDGSEGSSPSESGAASSEVTELGSADKTPNSAITSAVVGDGGVSADVSRFSVVAETVATNLTTQPPNVSAAEHRLAYHVLSRDQVATARAWHRFLGTLLLQVEIEATEHAKKSAAA